MEPQLNSATAISRGKHGTWSIEAKYFEIRNYSNWQLDMRCEVRSVGCESIRFRFRCSPLALRFRRDPPEFSASVFALTDI